MSTRLTGEPMKRELCNSFHESGGMRCIRPKGHAGRCWCKWAPLTGSPGYVTRGEWSMVGGFYHIGYVQRRLTEVLADAC